MHFVQSWLRNNVTCAKQTLELINIHARFCHSLCAGVNDDMPHSVIMDSFSY